MEELITFLRGWAPQAYGIWALVAMLAIHFYREWRETRKLSSSDRQARREGFERQVEILMKENRHLTGDLRELRMEYDEYRRICQEENHQRLLEIRRLENHIIGLERQIKQQSRSSLRLIEDIEKQSDNGRGKP